MSSRTNRFICFGSNNKRINLVSWATVFLSFPLNFTNIFSRALEKHFNPYKKVFTSPFVLEVSLIEFIYLDFFVVDEEWLKINQFFQQSLKSFWKHTFYVLLKRLLWQLWSKYYLNKFFWKNTLLKCFRRYQIRILWGYSIDIEDVLQLFWWSHY